MVIREHEGVEWIEGRGFPGWPFAGFALGMLAIMCVPPAFGLMELCVRPLDWSGLLAGVLSGVQLACRIACGVVLAGIAGVLVSVWWTWSTTFRLHAGNDQLTVRYLRCWGLLRLTAAIPLAAIDEVRAEMSSAVGGRMNLDIRVVAGARKRMVFRTGRSADAELVVAYLDRACGRPVRPDVARLLEQGWAVTRAKVAAGSSST